MAEGGLKPPEGAGTGGGCPWMEAHPPPPSPSTYHGEKKSSPSDGFDEGTAGRALPTGRPREVEMERR